MTGRLRISGPVATLLVALLVHLVGMALMNIALDLWFVTGLGWGVEGAALATVIAQAAAIVRLDL